MSSNIVDWKELKSWGLVDKINQDILYPLGLKLIITDTSSIGCIISKDLYFEPKSEEKERLKKRFETFIKNRYYYLKNYIDVREYRKQIEQKQKKE